MEDRIVITLSDQECEPQGSLLPPVPGQELNWVFGTDRRKNPFLSFDPMKADWAGVRRTLRRAIFNRNYKPVTQERFVEYGPEDQDWAEFFGFIRLRNQT